MAGGAVIPGVGIVVDGGTLAADKASDLLADLLVDLF
jgi:hypothetical protein